MDPRPLAPDQKTAALVDDFLAAQLRPRTRSTYETDVTNNYEVSAPRSGNRERDYLSYQSLYRPKRFSAA